MFEIKRNGTHSRWLVATRNASLNHLPIRLDDCCRRGGSAGGGVTQGLLGGPLEITLGNCVPDRDFDQCPCVSQQDNEVIVSPLDPDGATSTAGWQDRVSAVDHPDPLVALGQLLAELDCHLTRLIENLFCVCHETLLFGGSFVYSRKVYNKMN